MKYRVILRFETTIDGTESYNELIEDGYLPDEAERQIKRHIEQDCIGPIIGRADNTFYTPYDTDYLIEEIDD